MEAPTPKDPTPNLPILNLPILNLAILNLPTWNLPIRALVLLPLVAAPAAPAAPAGDPAKGHARQEDAVRAWRDNFTRAMKLADRTEMKKLVKGDIDQAVWWIIETAELISTAPSEAVFERMAALKEAWEGAHETDFCTQMERYFSLLDGPTKRERRKLKAQYDALVDEFNGNIEAKHVPTYTRCGVQFESLAGAFETLGDVFHVSQCRLFAGIAFDEESIGKDAELKRVTKNLKAFLDTRERLGLEDHFYNGWKDRYARLVALGYGGRGAEGAPEVDGRPGEVGESAVGATLEASLTFELVDEVDSFERPSFFLDAIYPIWNAISLSAKGSTTSVPRLENAPTVIREGAAEVLVDANHDGEGEVEVPLRGKTVPVVFDIGDGDAKRKWAFLAVTGNERDDYQGIEANLAPNDDYMNIYIAPAGSMVGTIGETPVRVFDDNLDGVYGSPMTAWGHIGLTQDHFQPEVDAILVGEGKRALPWSEFLQIDGQWYRLEPSNGGAGLVATEVKLRTGRLRLKYKGPDISYVIVRGANDYENCYFDLADGKPVDVPLGRYELCFGLVSEGKKRQVAKALMLPGGGTPSYDVLDEDEVVEIELGSPFGFEFDYTASSEEIVVRGNTVVVVGRAGERYERVWGARLRPEVSYRRAGTSRGSKAEDMPLVGTQNEMDDLGGWGTAWFPLDLVLEKKASETDVEVRLVDKKNKLFGKIESEWR